jgi:equilibrative nucleoside transporter 1/2/3
VKYYRTKAASEGSMTVGSDLAAAGVKTEQDRQVCLSDRTSAYNQCFVTSSGEQSVDVLNLQVEEDPLKHERLSTKQLLMQNIDYAVDIYLIYVLTLSIFPGFLSEDTGAHSLGTWYCFHLALVSGI